MARRAKSNHDNVQEYSIPTQPVDPDEKTDKSAVQQVKKTIKSEDYTTIYSNYSKVGISQWDLTIIFGQMVETEDAETVNEERVAIKFSPQYFKAVVSSLTTAIQQWENTFGKLEIGIGQNSNVKDMEKAFSNMKEFLENTEKIQNK